MNLLLVVVEIFVDFLSRLPLHIYLLIHPIA
jgi:hypothetical protein